MSPAQRLPADLHRDLLGALTIIRDRRPDKLRLVMDLHQAVDAESPMLAARFANLLNNCQGGEPFPPAEARLLGEVLLALEMWTGKRRGPKPRGNEYRVMVYLTEEEQHTLDAYCSRENITKADAVRRGIALLPDAR